MVVGSQGARQSFERVLVALPASFHASVIFDLHRAQADGFLERQLARRSPLEVRPAADGFRLEPATLYVAPQDRQLTLDDRLMMRFSPLPEATGHRSADPLLASAAQALGPRLIAVVLSGRLHGGAAGVREVKCHGGRVLVEEPSGAAMPSMPNAALATGSVDFALEPQKLGEALTALCASAGAAELFRVRLNVAVGG